MAGQLTFIPGRIPGVVVVEPAVFPDDRGFFTETYHVEKYPAHGIPARFVQDNYSHSKQHVLRGLHFQQNNPQGKLVFVIHGEILDVIVDMRKGSPMFGQWESVVLDETSHRQVYVPEGCAHGFVVRSAYADVMYKCTNLYSPKDDQGLLWSDPDLGIDWGIDAPLLSPKDAVQQRFRDIPEKLLPVYAPPARAGNLPTPGKTC